MTDVTYRLVLPSTSFLVLAAALAGCASRPPVVAVAPPAPPLPAAAMPAAMPAGGYAGMTIPAMADGTYSTPNRGLTAAGTIWHLRVALNVAALVCRGADQTGIVDGYNALLTREKAALATAQLAYEGEYRAADPGQWRGTYDNAQTRLYNFFSQSFARTGFCGAAAAAIADAAYVDDAALPAFAAGRLAVLDTPFTDFYRAYDAWRTQAPTAVPPPASTVVFAAAAPVAPRAGTTTVRPRLELDPSVFADTIVTP